MRLKHENLNMVDPAQSVQEQLLFRNLQRFRGRFVAHRLVYHATLDLRVIKKKKKYIFLQNVAKKLTTKTL